MKSLAAVAFRIVLVLGLVVLASSGVWAGSQCIISVGNINADTTCTVGDKTFNNFSFTGIPPDWTVTITEPSLNKFQVQVAQGGGTGLNLGGTVGAVYDFNYSVSVVEPAPPALPWYISEVDVSVDVSPGGGSDAKTIIDAGTSKTLGTITSTGAAVALTGLNETSLKIQEVITSNSAGTPDSFTDYFYEAQVPEPATMALMGAGLLGLGALLRRKKRV